MFTWSYESSTFWRLLLNSGWQVFYSVFWLEFVSWLARWACLLMINKVRDLWNVNNIVQHVTFQNISPTNKIFGHSLLTIQKHGLCSGRHIGTLCSVHPFSLSQFLEIHLIYLIWKRFSWKFWNVIVEKWDKTQFQFIHSRPLASTFNPSFGPNL